MRKHTILNSVCEKCHTKNVQKPLKMSSKRSVQRMTLKPNLCATTLQLHCGLHAPSLLLPCASTPPFPHCCSPSRSRATAKGTKMVRIWLHFFSCSNLLAATKRKPVLLLEQNTALDAALSSAITTPRHPAPRHHGVASHNQCFQVVPRIIALRDLLIVLCFFARGKNGTITTPRHPAALPRTRLQDVCRPGQPGAFGRQ